MGFRHRSLALVHEINDALDFPTTDILEDNDGMLARVVCEDFLEVWAAGRKDDFVGTYGGILTDQCAINKGLILEQGIKSVEHVTLMIIPTQ